LRWSETDGVIRVKYPRLENGEYNSLVLFRPKQDAFTDGAVASDDEEWKREKGR